MEVVVNRVLLDEDGRYLNAAPDLLLLSMQITFLYCRSGSIISRRLFVITALMQTDACSSHSLLLLLALHTPWYFKHA